MTRKLAILLFNDVEELDFVGPFEVFNAANKDSQEQHFNVYTVSEDGQAIKTRHNLRVIPDYSLADCPAPDILLVPGGFGSRAVLKNESVLEWIQMLAPRVERLLSVCTGALILAKAGLLEGLKATTHHCCFDELTPLAPTATVVKNVKYVDNGRVILSAGISAGINMSLYVVARLVGPAVALQAAQEMEYDWSGIDPAQEKIPYFVDPAKAPELTQLPGLETTILTGLHGEKMMMVLNATLPGQTVPLHTHPHEQIGMVYAGQAKLRIGDEERLVKKGDFYCIPADVPHGDTCLDDEPFVMLDIFYPIREDFVEKLKQM